jgi:hypothetical protein
LDISAYRNNRSIDINIYRKPTETGTVIHLTSNHPYEQKMAAFNFYINRILTMPIREQSKQEEWKTILAVAKKKGYPTSIIHNLKTNLMTKKQKQLKENKTIPTYFIPLVRRITNLFRLI